MWKIDHIITSTYIFQSVMCAQSKHMIHNTTVNYQICEHKLKIYTVNRGYFATPVAILQPRPKIYKIL